MVLWHVVRWGSCLRHCAANRKPVRSISDGVIWIFIYLILPTRTVALGSNQPLTDMSTRNISWEVKSAGAYG